MSDKKVIPDAENRKIKDLTARRPELSSCIPSILKAAAAVIRCYEQGGKVLVCGNGGSAADAEHIVGELMKGFMKKRPLSAELKSALVSADAERGAELARKLQTPLPAAALTGQVSLSTAFANDVDCSFVFAQQVLGFGRPGDVLIGISTSGNAENVQNALVAAIAVGMTTIGLTGASGGAMAEYCGVLIAVPETSTPLVQELHLPVYHALCAMAEEYFFAE